MSLSKPLSGRHALVCGASAGIGQAAAQALAQAGASLTLLARRRDRLANVANELQSKGAESIQTIVADLDQRAELGELLDELVQKKPVHILIHNTGGPPAGPLLQADPEAFETAFGRHVLAGQIMVQKLVPGMKEAGYGRIINVVSTSVREPIPNLGVSNTIRGAVASWAKSLSRELPPGITINNVLPGFTDTERLSSLAEGRARREGSSADQVRANWLAQVPEGRLGRAVETAAAVAFLCSPAAAYIRGVSLPVDGGRLRGI